MFYSQIEQYKSVVFYGLPGSGKSHLASQLAEFVQVKYQEQNLNQVHFFFKINLVMGLFQVQFSTKVC